MEIITGPNYLAHDAEKLVENLERQEKDAAKKKEENQKAYEKQLKEFKEDNSYFGDYKEEVRKDKHVLLRLFRFNPTKDFWTTTTLQAPAPSLNSIINENVTVDYEITNIAKVIKVGPGSEYKQGDIVYLPYDRVQGHIENPLWVDYKHSQMVKGADAIEPDDKRKLIPAIEQNYKMYSYKKPKNAVMDEEDRLTYCIVDLEIVTSE